MKRDVTTASLDGSTACGLEVDWLMVKVCNVSGLDVLFCRVPATGTVDDVKYAVADALWQRVGLNFRPRQFFLELQGHHVPFSMALSRVPVVYESFYLRRSPA